MYIYICISLARQAAVPPPRLVTVGAFTEGLLKIEEKTKRPPKTLETNQKTIPNEWRNVVGTASAPKRAFEGGGRTPPEPRRTILGSILGPEIRENREKHHLEKT